MLNLDISGSISSNIQSVVTTYSLCLYDFRQNLTVHHARSPLNHSYSYGSSDDHPTCFASFSLAIEPFAPYGS